MRPRVIVTGGRDYNDIETLTTVLSGVQDNAILVHGACPTGADQLASTLWLALGRDCEPHPADWSLGKRAGPKRNREMAQAGADYCIAFPGDKGTKNMIKEAERCKIPVVTVARA